MQGNKSSANENIKILNGNELLIEGALEAGYDLYTGYPGSPLADFFNILYARKKEIEGLGAKVVIANSEANAAAMASGAKMAGKNVLVAMKSMGLHVASDALSVGNFANPGTELEESSGVVIAVGDDPWSISTSTPADSRFLFMHLHIPFLEPSNPQELKDWMEHALAISQKTSVYQGLLLNTQLAEGGGRVEARAYRELDGSEVELDPSKFNLQKNVMVPPNSLVADEVMIKERFPEVVKTYDELSLDRTEGDKQSKVAFVTAGVIYETLKQYLDDFGLLERFKLIKLASSYPLREKWLEQELKGIESIVVVEEKRGFLEAQLRQMLQKTEIQAKLYGKKFDELEGLPAHGGINYEVLSDSFSRLQKIIPELKVDCVLDQTPGVTGLNLPKRLPTFCPGCPHRETLSLLKELRSVLDKKGMSLISHGDVGCYSLSFLQPFKEMHDLSAMGQGGALAAGNDIFTENPSVVLMGDSTFFHSGLSAISNSVQCGHNITYILLDNDNTAMTGHQMTPRTGEDVTGYQRPRQDMLNIVQSMGVDSAVEVNPSDRFFYKNLLEDYLTKNGTKVIISNKECGLTYHGRLKREQRKVFSKGERLPKKQFYQINTDTCEDCRECVEMTGCPGLSQTFDAYGSKVKIDPQICVGDGYCTKIEACPSFELVEVADYAPVKVKIEDGKDLMAEAKPKVSLDQIAKGEDYRIVVIGVGGSGVTTISRVLAEAAKDMGGRQDIDFKFVDQKGLAQRNGSVMGHLSLYKKGKAHGALNPKGKVHLLLSPDLLEGARAIDYLGKDAQAVIDGEFQLPLSILLDRALEVDPINSEQLRGQLVETLGQRVHLKQFKNLSFDNFSKSVYASAMILGHAYQLGVLPFTHKDLVEAFKRAVPRAEIDNNLRAFEMGRSLVGQQDKEISGSSQHLSTIQRYRNSISQDKKWQQLFDRHLGELHQKYPEILPEHWAQYLHDLYVYDKWEKLPRALEDIVALKKSNPEKDLFIKAVSVLIRTYFVKDEVFVSHLLSSRKRSLEDKDNYSKMGSYYDVTNINRPEFIIFGKHIVFNINPRRWMFLIMKRLRVLRSLLTGWHQKERQIAAAIRECLLNELPSLDSKRREKRIRELSNIKGYREVRYRMAKQYLGEQF